MTLPDKLTPEQSAAIVACLKIFAELGDDEDAPSETEKAKSAEPCQGCAADLASDNGKPFLRRGNTDAKTF